ncbi:tetraacyldisaccharide 4'-kinase [Actibacterium sp. 188UL27-1]|uniref:tetraacyldisaccharide 4'-kinase n=1 Tax=Actibacterium sp. 188UL27-1 TaxID=2786961 RepID=UPI00195A8091|nr:tetraacyldisaccharide 4'-kinase [Actibacterium sp. 188UL27-1]MBM7070144.1 tetraacyldisaccharide 4'-kinase [Actibacterium sp. 188UL27-1]
MPAPAFWNTGPARRSWQAHLLRPLGAIYAGATARRLRKGHPHRADIPVICVGNLNVGGTGKTPTAMALAMALGDGVGIVSRGHGGQLTGPVKVDPNQMTAGDVGDEPLLLSAFAQVWIGRARDEAVQLAETDGDLKVIILDDGFQNPFVHKDLSIIVVDAQTGFGNGLCLPAGPLREPVAAGLARADLVLSIGDETAQDRFSETWGNQVTVPRLTGHLAPLQTGMDWTGLPVMAFAGIGRPAKFFQTLRTLGVDLRDTRALEDHQPLTPALMTRLEAEAKAKGAQLVTTEKDAVRLPAEFRPKVLTVPVRLQIHDWDPLQARLTKLGL